MMEWQPIETAPKDGTRVLLYSPVICDIPILHGEWRDFGDGEADWRCDADKYIPDPTHWMPLPAPPHA